LADFFFADFFFAALLDALFRAAMAEAYRGRARTRGASSSRTCVAVSLRFHSGRSAVQGRCLDPKTS
jgi:hypothetical protein